MRSLQGKLGRKSDQLAVAKCLLQVAMQIASVVRYLATVGFIMWDVHHEDVLIDHLGKVTFLDIFMGPSECLASTPEVLVPDHAQCG